MNDLPEIELETPKKQKKSEAKKAYQYVTTAILSVVMIAVIAALAMVFIQVARGQKPNLFGYRVYYVMTDSMTPSIKVGDVLIERVFDPEKDAALLTEDTVISYVGAYGDYKGMSITHRIIEGVHYDKAHGKYVVTTQGTKEGATIDPPVPVENIEAVMVRKSSLITGLYSVFKSTAGLICITVIPCAFMIAGLLFKLFIQLKTKKPKETVSPEAAQKAEAERQAVIEAMKKKFVEEFVKKEGEINAEKPDMNKVSDKKPPEDTADGSSSTEDKSE